MDDLLLSTCGPEPIPVADAVAAVQGYMTAKRWLLVRTPSHPDGHWVRVPAYRFDAYDAQPRDADPGSLTLSTLAAEGLHGADRDVTKRFEFYREVEVLLPLIERAVQHAGGRAFWELPVTSAQEGPVVEALDAARGLSQPDHGNAVLHHHRPDLFPLLSRHTEKAVGAVASVRSSTPWSVVHQDLIDNQHQFTAANSAFASEPTRPLTRLRVHDQLTWMVASHRWADALREGKAAQP